MTDPAFEFRRETVTAPAASRLILALNEELLGRYPERGTESHFRLDADEVAPGRGAFLVAYENDRPVGCGAVRRLDAGTAEIKRMYVLPALRGRGLGARLLEALEAEARGLGVRRVVLETGPRQPEAIALYARAGYSEIPGFGEHMPSELSVFMEKRL